MAIRVLVTGGTIDGLDYSRESDAPKRRRSRVPSIFKDARITSGHSISILFLKDSRFIDSADLESLASACRRCAEKRILVTHGSMTMPATAKYLASKKLGKTIVLTGAITPAAHSVSDSKFNIGFAFAAAQFLPAGVYVAMNGKVFPASNVRKNMKTGYFENERGQKR
ncbi:MAG: asparaginase domain-containing protein [Candidatus Micrarchaeia archaeon]